MVPDPSDCLQSSWMDMNSADGRRSKLYSGIPSLVPFWNEKIGALDLHWHVKLGQDLEARQHPSLLRVASIFEDVLIGTTACFRRSHFQDAMHDARGGIAGVNPSAVTAAARNDPCASQECPFSREEAENHWLMVNLETRTQPVLSWFSSCHVEPHVGSLQKKYTQLMLFSTKVPCLVLPLQGLINMLQTSPTSWWEPGQGCWLEAAASAASQTCWGRHCLKLQSGVHRLWRTSNICLLSLYPDYSQLLVRILCLGAKPARPAQRTCCLSIKRWVRLERPELLAGRS